MAEVQQELLKKLCDLNDRRKQQEEALAQTVKDLDIIRQEVISQMIDAGFKQVTFCDKQWLPEDTEEATGPFIERASISLSQKLAPSYFDADTFHEFLKLYNLDSMRKVHARTLDSWFNNDLPDYLQKKPKETNEQYDKRMQVALGLRVFIRSTLSIRRK